MTGPVTCHEYCAHIYIPPQYGPDRQAHCHPGIRTSHWKNDGQ